MTYTVVWEHHAMTEFRRLRQVDPAGAKDRVAAVRILADGQRLPTSSALGWFQLLLAAQLEDDYAAAWDEWDASDDAALWDQTTGDGVSGAAR